MGLPAKQPGLGVGAYVMHQGKVLFGYRTSGHASGVWAPPGGHVEFGESPTETCSRETFEECGLNIPPNAWRLRAVTNDYFPDNQTHYITLAFVAESKSDQAEVREPHKLSEWRWVDPHNLPQPQMASVEHALRAGLALSKVDQSVVTNLNYYK